MDADLQPVLKHPGGHAILKGADLKSRAGALAGLSEQIQLPEFSPVPLYRNGFRLIELFVLFEFALRLRFVANFLIREPRLAQPASWQSRDARERPC
jgi:hypothetical protein